jgi:hypothetical protein
MKSIEMRLYTQSGDEIDAVPLEGFAVSEDGEELLGGNNQEIIERVSALYDTVVTLLQERQAEPGRGRTWLKIALGEALLTADEHDGDVVLQIIVQPLTEGEEDEFDDSTDN